MQNDFEIINPIGYPGWDDLLLSHPDYSFFHTSHWARVLHDSYGYKPCYFTMIDNHKLSACIPVMEVRSILTGTRGVSLPFTDYCIPFVPDADSLDNMFSTIVQYGEKAGWQSIEMRGGEKLPQRWPRYAGYYGHSLDLHSSEESLLSNIKDSTRRNIRKAQREEVTVSMSNVSEATEEFYRLNCITRKAHGLPPQPAHFFKKIQEHILSKDHGIIALARHNGRAIAGAVYFQFGKRIMYKYGASDRHYLQKRPNDLIMWEAIKWSRRQGYDSLCFGRTEPENEGLRAFKNGWGTEEKTIRYAFYDVMQKGFMAGSTTGRTVSAAILRRMPILFLKFIGEALYRHVG